MDQDEKLGSSKVEKLNEEFGRNRAIFVICDVTKGSEFDGLYNIKIEDLKKY